MELRRFSPGIGVALRCIMLEQSLGFKSLVTLVGVDSICKDLYQVGVCQQWDTKVHGCSAHEEVVFQSLRFVGRNVDAKTNLLALDQVKGIWSIIRSLFSGYETTLQGTLFFVNTSAVALVAYKVYPSS